jgi:hypothetical protein
MNLDPDLFSQKGTGTAVFLTKFGVNHINIHTGKAVTL